MNLQFLIVIVLVILAVSFAANSLWRKRAAFSTKEGCGSDCGCGANGK